MSNGTIQADDFITLDELARRLNYSPKTIRNKIAVGVFRRGVHYAEAPGLPMMFRWSAVLSLYQWASDASTHEPTPTEVDVSIPMARGYLMK